MELTIAWENDSIRAEERLLESNRTVISLDPDHRVAFRSGSAKCSTIAQTMKWKAMREAWQSRLQFVLQISTMVGSDEFLGSKYDFLARKSVNHDFSKSNFRCVAW